MGLCLISVEGFISGLPSTGFPLTASKKRPMVTIDQIDAKTLDLNLLINFLLY
jgi:hypothetical protein